MNDDSDSGCLKAAAIAVLGVVVGAIGLAVVLMFLLFNGWR